MGSSGGPGSAHLYPSEQCQLTGGRGKVSGSYIVGFGATPASDQISLQALRSRDPIGCRGSNLGQLRARRAPALPSVADNLLLSRLPRGKTKIRRAPKPPSKLDKRFKNKKKSIAKKKINHCDSARGLARFVGLGLGKHQVPERVLGTGPGPAGALTELLQREA